MSFPQGGYQIDASVTDTEARGGNILVPEGEYLLEFKGVGTVAEDREKHPLILQCEIVEGPGGKGRRISHFCPVFTEKGGSWLGQAYKSIGGDPAKLAGMKVPTYDAYQKIAAALAKTFTGKRCGATIMDNVYQGTRSSRISEFYSADDYAERSKLNAAVPEAPNGSAGVVDEAMGADIDALTASL